MKRLFPCCVLLGALFVVPLLAVPAGAAVKIDHSLDLALGDALAAGKVDEVGRLLKAGADPDAKTADETATPMLILAAAVGDSAQMARLLVEDGAKLEATNAPGDTALAVAAMKGHLETVKYLVKAGAKLESNGDIGLTPLMFAAATGNTEIVRALLAAGAKVNALSRDGGSALVYNSTKSAAGTGNLDIAKQLVAAGADVSVMLVNGDTAHEVARKNGLLDVETYLQGIDDRDRALLSAAEQGKWDGIRAALAAGANPRYAPLLFESEFADEGTSKTPAMWLKSDAVGFDAGIAAQILARSDLEAHSFTGTKVGTGEDATYKIELGETALILAVEHDDEVMVRLLLKAGARPDTMAPSLDESALMVAAETGRLAIAKLLVTAGGNRDLKNGKGDSAVSLSKKSAYKGVADYFDSLPKADEELPGLGDLLK